MNTPAHAQTHRTCTHANRHVLHMLTKRTARSNTAAEAATKKRKKKKQVPLVRIQQCVCEWAVVSAVYLTGNKESKGLIPEGPHSGNDTTD